MQLRTQSKNDMTPPVSAGAGDAPYDHWEISNLVSDPYYENAVARTDQEFQEEIGGRRRGVENQTRSVY
jgi:hypothetical protein